MALKNRRIETQIWCSFCNHDPETDFHVLVQCPFARNVWCLTSIGSFVGTASSFKDWWIALTSNHSPTDIDRAAMILWNIWIARNELIWNGITRPANFIFQSASDSHNQWLIANSRNKSPPHSAHQSTHVWTFPPENFVKCNVDAALFKDPPRMGYGCIIRDASGAIINAKYGCFQGNFLSSTVEALGVREALSWIKELKLINVIIKSDALLVINVIHSSVMDVFKPRPFDGRL
ncbi:uncharacterized protein [Henckelia pumila]|uniref:uncharacterized protein n=1 Tax=Henckelia pumila TaxID=405737 RepID=UPI003C6E4B0A